MRIFLLSFLLVLLIIRNKAFPLKFASAGLNSYQTSKTFKSNNNCKRSEESTRLHMSLDASNHIDNILGGVSSIVVADENVRQVFSASTFTQAAQLLLAVVVFIVPYILFNNYVAPKLGMIDPNAPSEFEEGQEPWR